MAGKKHRVKGDAGERELVHILTDLGVPCFRKVASGSGWPTDLTNVGDIGLINEPDTHVEVKRRARAFGLLYDALEKAQVVFCRDDRHDWLVVQKVSADCDFVRLRGCHQRCLEDRTSPEDTF